MKYDWFDELKTRIVYDDIMAYKLTKRLRTTAKSGENGLKMKNSEECKIM